MNIPFYMVWIIGIVTSVSWVYDFVLISRANGLEDSSVTPDNETLDKYIACSNDPVYQRDLTVLLR